MVPTAPDPAGETMPPDAGDTAPPTLPVPPRSAPPAMLTFELAGSCPFTISAPAETVVLPVYEWLPVNTSVPPPALVNAPPPVPTPVIVKVVVAVFTSIVLAVLAL